MENVTQQNANRITLAPTGKLQANSENDSFLQSINSALDTKVQNITIDLDDISSIDSIHLEHFLSVHESLVSRGGQLALINASNLHQDIFRITGLKEHLNITHTNQRNLINFPESKRTGSKPLLGEMLLEAGLASQEDIDNALHLQSTTGERMGKILVAKGCVNETDMLEVLSYQLQVPFVKLKPGLYDPAVASLIKKPIAERLEILPLFKIHNKIIIGTHDPQAIPSFDEIEQMTDCEVKPILVESKDVQQYLNDIYDTSSIYDHNVGFVEEDFEIIDQELSDNFEAIDELAAKSPVVNLVNSIIQRAIRDQASDIHIEPGRTKTRIRLRIDGALYEVMNPSVEVHPALVSRLKIMANLDISERRLPQDGRIQVSTSGRVVDLRFSSLPGIFGEKVVLRVLDKNQSILDLDKLDMTPLIKNDFKGLLDHNHGLILVTGPTGSGKTTSLYAALNYLNSPEQSIVTIEDPVEYQIETINQNQIKESTNLTFAKLLKHVLRQDPDIVMVGEIRDHETAEIAIQAALTGHLVLSTLHTNTAIGAVTRLLDMGIQPYLLSSALIGVLAKRLVRTVCEECKTTYIATDDIIERYHLDNTTRPKLVKGRGCASCYDSGFKGRTGIYELIIPDGGLQKLMIGNPTREELNRHITHHGIKTLFDDGMLKVLDGMTTIEEVERVANMDM